MLIWVDIRTFVLKKRNVQENLIVGLDFEPNFLTLHFSCLVTIINLLNNDPETQQPPNHPQNSTLHSLDSICQCTVVACGNASLSRVSTISTPNKCSVQSRETPGNLGVEKIWKTTGGRRWEVITRRGTWRAFWGASRRHKESFRVSGHVLFPYVKIKWACSICENLATHPIVICEVFFSYVIL